MVAAQVVYPALDKDPVFHEVLARQIQYPRYSMRNFPLYGRVYAGFRIDAKGRIGNVTILSPGNTQSGFDNEVIQALKHMPSLNPRYAGNYVLPVAFCYLNRSQSPNTYCPLNHLDDRYLTERLLLQEWNCTLDFQPAKGSFPEPKEAWGFYTKK